MSDPRVHDAVLGFEAAVERYQRGRPSYPDDAVEYLVRELRIAEDRDVLELGAGTGKFTELLVPTGARLTALEPLPAMREALERACPTVTVMDGVAERIPVPDGSMHAVVAASCFHWFDGDRALAEIHRVLPSGGVLGLVWNVRDEASDWAERLTAIFDRLAGEGAPRYRTGAWRSAFDRTTLFGPLHHRVAYHVHEVSREGFVDRVLSVSYVARATTLERERVLAEVQELLESDPDLRGRDMIPMPYRTDVFWTSRR
ncbi:MAG: methyltransferase domain-containing protein [Actinobacteria bacterium]|nr:methyltransferase domain-containing protein [Actinomycetota bacterium]